MTAFAFLKQIGGDPETFQNFMENALSEMFQGEVDPLEFHVIVSNMAKGFAFMKEQSLSDALGEAAKHGKKFEFKGFKIMEKEAGTTWDFSPCYHPELLEVSQQIKDLSEVKKSIETTLKTLTKPMDIVVEGGEVVTVNPPIKKSKTILQIGT